MRLGWVWAAAVGLAGAGAAQDAFVVEVRLAADRPAIQGKLEPGNEKLLEETLQKRLSILGPETGKVTVSSPDDIRVRVPIAKVTEAQLKGFTRIGKLELRELTDVRTGANPGGRYLLDMFIVQDRSQERRPPAVRFQDTRTGRLVAATELLKHCPLVLSNEDLVPGTAKRLDGFGTSVRIQFNDKGAERLTRFTRKAGRLLAISLDGEVIAIHASAQQVTPLKRRKRDKGEKEEDPKVDRLDLTGGFSGPDEAGFLAAVLNSGPLPYPLVVKSQEPEAG